MGKIEVNQWLQEAVEGLAKDYARVMLPYNSENPNEFYDYRVEFYQATCHIRLETSTLRDTYWSVKKELSVHIMDLLEWDRGRSE